MATTLGALTRVCGGTCHSREADVDSLAIARIGVTAQDLDSSSLFAAVPGTRAHGARFAAKSEAAAILTDPEGLKILEETREKRPIIVVDHVRSVLGLVASAVYGDPSAQLTIIGVTGTAGKTTVSHMLEHGLLKLGYATGMIGTNGTRINGTPIPTSLTTPEAPVLQELFRHMVDEKVTHVVMEVSSHALSLGRVIGTRFAVGGFTNLSHDHLDFHNSMDEYFAAKATFFTPGSALRADRQVINVDSLWGKKLAVMAGPAAETLSTQGNPASWQAVNIVDTATGGSAFSLNHLKFGETTSVTGSTILPGHFNVANAALAVSLAATVGVNAAAMAEAIADAVVPGRMEPVNEGQNFTALVDYAHKPAAVAAILDTVTSHTSGRVAIVLGAGGDRDHAKRPVMGQEAAQRAQLVVVTDDNPRSEDPETIRQEIVDGIRELSLARKHGKDKPVKDKAAKHPGRKEQPAKKKPLAEVKVIGDRAEAIAFAVDWAQPGDTVIVAGKGHETGQIIGDTVIEFDDRVALRDAIRARAQRDADAVAAAAEAETTDEEK